VDVFEGEIFLSTRHPKDLIWFKGEKKQENFSHYPGADLQEKIANAFKKEGVSIFSKLEHDFVLILMEAQTGRIYLVRDRFGLEPLYYSFQDGKLVFRQKLWPAGLLMPEKILSYLSEWNAYEGPSEETTYYSQVFQVLPGHFTCLSSDMPRETQPYWRPHIREKVASSEEIYSAFENSIKRCTAPYSRVGAAVSGGLDSSSVALAYVHKSGRRIPTFTYQGFDAVSEDPYYARLVHERVSSEAYIVPPDTDLYSLIEEQSLALGRPMSMLFPPAHQAALSRCARGLEAVLTGHDGDSVVGHGFDYLQGLKLGGHWKAYYQLLRKYLALRGVERSPEHVQKEFRYCLSRPSQVPRFLLSAVQEMDYRPQDLLKYFTEFTTKAPSISFLRTELEVPKLTSSPFDAVINAAFPTLIEELQFWARKNGHVHLFPFFDRVLYETCLSVPEQLRFGEGRTRLHFRNAVKHILPSELYHRYSKDDAGTFCLSSAQHLLSNHLDRFMECKSLWEYVDKEKFSMAVKELYNDKLPVNLKRPLVRKLNRVLYLGVWLNSLQS
jgi:asparagine synthase (glutamine-hydrolysing)